MANPGLVKMLGYDSEDELRALDSIADLYTHPEQRAEVLRRVEWGEETQIEMNRKDGRTLTVRISGSAVAETPDGETVFQGMVQDITDQVALEEQLRQSQRLEALGQLASGVAHDFNNILSVIIVEAQLAMRRLEDDDPMRERLTEIKAAGDRATGLTRQLLAFARKQVVEPVVTSLNRLVSDIASMLSRLISEDIHLTIAPAKSVGNVRVDRGQIEQVLTNLVVNARDAMPRGGELTIRTAMTTPDEAFVRTRPGLTSRPYAVLEVQDTGTGITDDVKAKMFDPLFTTKARGQGTGLGLATVYGIVQKMDGHIDVETEVGVGTTMRIYLPIVDEEESEGPSTAAASPLPTGDETVLVVEDDARLRRIAVQLLEEHGYTVMAAEDGLQALEQLEAYEGELHLLLTDVVMPKMGGREVAQRIQELRPGVSVLYMSGYIDDDALRERLAAHEAFSFAKPFTAESLTAAVRQALDRGGAGDRPE